MTQPGSRPPWIVLGAVVVGFVALLVGCATVGPVTQVTVPDVKSVTGTWKGMVYRSGFEPDYVTLTIQDNGSFDFVSTQKVGGASRARGKVAVSDGRVLLEGEGGGRGVGTLLRNPAGDFVMNVDGTFSDNSTLTAKLFPSR